MKKATFLIAACTTTLLLYSQDFKLPPLTDPTTNNLSENSSAADQPTKMGTFDYVDIKYGFKDIKLEEQLSEIQKRVSVKKIISSEGLSLYDVSDPKYLSVGSCKLKRLSIGVFQNKVLSILIETGDYTGSNCLLGTLVELFGEGFKSNEYIEQYAWAGKKAIIIYDENSVNNSANTFIKSIVFGAKYNEYLKKLKKQRARDF